MVQIKNYLQQHLLFPIASSLGGGGPPEMKSRRGRWGRGDSHKMLCQPDVRGTTEIGTITRPKGVSRPNEQGPETHLLGKIRDAYYNNNIISMLYVHKIDK